ncbi:MAG: winged helix-turn-helix domain-containing protein, partial [Cereibacter sp.]
MTPVLPNAAARRLFLQLHGLGEVPAGPAKGADLAALIARIGFVQVDSIPTVERAHHMILFARRPAYRPPALKRLLERDRALFEHWTHDASVLPIHLFPYWQLRFARDADRLHGNWKRWFRDGYEAQFDSILNRIAAQGPVTSSDVGEGEARGRGGWWDWHPSKTALEWLWRTGQVQITRRDSFQKVYDLTERVIPQEHRLPCPPVDAVVDWACASALDRLGFATPGEICAYWNAVTPQEVRAWCKA